jgi:hypothetical protein
MVFPVARRISDDRSIVFRGMTAVYAARYGYRQAACGGCVSGRLLSCNMLTGPKNSPPCTELLKNLILGVNFLHIGLVLMKKLHRTAVLVKIILGGTRSHGSGCIASGGHVPLRASTGTSTPAPL